MKNYFNRNIDIRSQLKKYRADLNQRYPDPIKKEQTEESQASPVKAEKKAPPPAKSPDKKKGSKLNV